MRMGSVFLELPINVFFISQHFHFNKFYFHQHKESWDPTFHDSGTVLTSEVYMADKLLLLTADFPFKAKL